MTDKSSWQSVISFSYNIVAISSIQRLQWLSISGTDKSRAQSRRHVLIPSAVFAFIFARLGAGVAAYYDDERTTTGALTIAFDMVAVFVYVMTIFTFTFWMLANNALHSYCVLAVAVVNVWDIYQYMLEICSNKASNQHQLGLKAPPRKSSQGAPE